MNVGVFRLSTHPRRKKGTNTSHADTKAPCKLRYPAMCRLGIGLVSVGFDQPELSTDPIVGQSTVFTWFPPILRVLNPFAFLVCPSSSFQAWVLAETLETSPKSGLKFSLRGADRVKIPECFPSVGQNVYISGALALKHSPSDIQGLFQYGTHTPPSPHLSPRRLYSLPKSHNFLPYPPPPHPQFSRHVYSENSLRIEPARFPECILALKIGARHKQKTVRSGENSV